jgi:hypothetical protein
VVQGWLPDHAGGYGGIRPIPTAIYRKEAAGTVTLLYALCPTAGVAASPVKSAEFLADRLTVRLTDGTERRVRFERLTPARVNAP